MMPNQDITVIPIQRDIFVSEADKTVADLAYNLWLSSAFRGGSPEQALVAALEMVRGRAPARLFLVPKPERRTDA
jgi:hypothetical protein